MRLLFRGRAVEDLEQLPPEVQQRIVDKIDFYIRSPNPLAFATPLTHAEIIGHYRFRIGDYRVVFDVEQDAIIILRIGHRREIYRR